MVPEVRPLLIKYLGSKRRLVPALATLAEASAARSTLDLFTGTTRVAQAFKQLGCETVAVDRSRTSDVLARCYIATDGADATVAAEAAEALAWLDQLPGEPGYVTETFCRASRYFQPANGERIDAIRVAIEREFAGSRLWPVLMTSLLEAADRVDSTTGLQMAYLKQWSDRSHQRLALRMPVLLAGSGRAVQGDACHLVGRGDLGPVDLAYLDPPYNQHRYDSNYHVWETLVAWDAPAHYGIACKRQDLRNPETRSVFNSRRTMPAALSEVIARVDAEVVVLSYNNESWLGFEELREICASRGCVEVLAFDSARYVGARIGIHSPAGRKVGQVSHLRNTEYVVVAGPRGRVRRMTDAVADAGLGVRADRPVAVAAG